MISIPAGDDRQDTLDNLKLGKVEVAMLFDFIGDYTGKWTNHGEDITIGSDLYTGGLPVRKLVPPEQGAIPNRDLVEFALADDASNTWRERLHEKSGVITSEITTRGSRGWTAPLFLSKSYIVQTNISRTVQGSYVLLALANSLIQIDAVHPVYMTESEQKARRSGDRAFDQLSSLTEP